jgi:glycerate kinase
MATFAAICGRRSDGRDPAVALGAGAGGGLGYGLMQLGAQRDPGIATVMELVELPQRVATADLVLTGEGSLDDQSLRGKVISGVVTLARHHARPCVVVAGQVRLGRRELGAAGIDAAYSMADMVGLERALAEPSASLEEVASRVARAWGQ